MQGKVFAYLGIGIALLFGIIGSFILKVNDLKVIIALTLVALSSYVLIELFIKLFAKNREEV